MPNTELGHLELDGKGAERRASERARERKGWSWRHCGDHVNASLPLIERLFSPDLIIIGGGVSRKADRFFPRLRLASRVVPAAQQNQAGIIGAAFTVRVVGPPSP